MKIIVDQDNLNQRLDKFLTEKLSGQTRSQIKKMIQNGLVLVNDKKISVHNFLKTGDTITISDATPSTPTAKTESTEKIIIEPEIIFEDENYLIINKPIGLLVHPTEKNETNTLVDWLLKKYPSMEKVGEQKYRIGIIHRLDRDVSGVMIVAKTNDAFFHLKDQFKRRQVKKEYWALAYGQFGQDEGEIDLPIGRNKDGQFVAHPRLGKEKFADSDKIAKTRYHVIERIKNYTLLKINILTGRTHQIRAHLFAIGHPILGDKIYKPKRKIFIFFQRKIRVVDPGRLFLHSEKIGFYDLNNQWREFESPLPEQLKNYLYEIKK